MVTILKNIKNHLSGTKLSKDCPSLDFKGLVFIFGAI